MTAVELAKRPFTIIRTRLVVHISSDQLAVDELQVAALGVCVVSSQAVAIGVTAVPTPVSDAGSDLWLAHQPMVGEFAFVTGVGFDAAGGKQYMIDSKAQRKVNDDQELIIVVQNSVLSANGAQVTILGRILIKEH